MKKLDVKLIRQPQRSVECGLACTSMILDYHGIPHTMDEIRNSIPIDNIGTYAPQIAIFFIKKGLQVTIQQLHPCFFTIDDVNVDMEKIKKRIESRKKTEHNARNIKIINYYLDFINLGGIMEVKIPSIEDIITEIAGNRPLIAGLTRRVLGDSTPEFDSHFTAVIGYDETSIYTNDPYDNECGGNKKHEKNAFIYAVHASCYGDLDNAAFIKVSKP